MPGADHMTIPAARPAKRPPARIPTDLLLVTLVAALLWLVTLWWQWIDLDAILRASLRTEQDMWFFGLVLGAPYLLVTRLAWAWGAILGVATCLAATAWLMRHRAWLARWLAAGGVTAAIFIGVPLVLNAQEAVRLRAVYAPGETAGTPDLAGRAVEVRRDTLIPFAWLVPITCPDMCTDLLAFGRARSLTLTYPGQQDREAEGPVAMTYRWTPTAKGCLGQRFRGHCPHFVDGPPPADRLVLDVADVTPRPADAGLVVGRRISLLDTRRPGAAPARLTRLRFSRYSALLNPVWTGGALHLRREPLPIDADDALTTEVFRALVPRTIDGHFYPFR